MITIYRSQASASLRRIPMWLVGSDGTTPASAGGGQPQINWLARGTATVNTAATLSLVSANAGEHYVELSASEVSALGVAAVHFRSAAVLPQSTYFQITNVDSGNSVDMGLTAFSETTLHAGTHSNVTIQGVTRVNSGVTLNADTHSGATIQGVTRVNSSVTLNADTHSGATIQGLTLLNSSVTLRSAEYSAVTVRIGLIDYSGATIGTGNVKAGSYSGVTVEVSNFGRSSMQSMADRFLSRALAMGSDTGRNVQDALRSLRNRIAIGGSTLTIYTEDDVTSAWTASVTTSSSANQITGYDPGGP